MPRLSIPLPTGAGAYGCEVVDPMGQPTGGAEITVTALDGHRVVAAAGVVLPPARSALLPARQLELPSASTWLFDFPHTAIRFIAKHVGVARVHGRFTRCDGGIRIAPDMPDSQVSVRIDASSIATGNTSRDNHLRSADFLDVERH